MMQNQTAMSYLNNILSEYIVLLHQREGKDPVDKEIMAMFMSLTEFIEEHLYKVEYEQIIEANKLGLKGQEARAIFDNDGHIVRVDYKKSDIYETIKAN